MPAMSDRSVDHRPKMFVGWVRKWGGKWSVHCRAHTESAVAHDLQKEFGKQYRVSTLILREGETPYYDKGNTLQPA